MPDDHPASSTDNAFCLGCGYPLRRLESNRCPECGRAFHPADPRTMSLGRALRSWQRGLLRPPGWPLLALALLGTAGIIYLGGRPYIAPEPLSVLRDEFRWPAQSLRPFTAPDIIFFVTVCLWAVFLFLFSSRQLARLLVPIEARRGSIFASSVRRRNRLVAVATAVSACWLVFGWQDRIGRRWIVRILKPDPTMPYPLWLPSDPSGASPVQLEPDQLSQVLGDAIAHLPKSRDRMAVMKLLVEHSGRTALPGLVRIAEAERDSAMLVWELRLIGLCRNPESASLLTARLKDSRSEVRAAAADAIGILRHPSYSVGVPSDSFWIKSRRSLFDGNVMLDSTPRINLDDVVSRPPTLEPFFNIDAEHDLLDDPQIAIDPSVRAILQRMMTDGATADEREAAARTLVAWPPESYQLRVAEWGVWINNNGRLALARSIIDEIPPFVHRTGNPISSFDEYFLAPMEVTKPIVHFTSNVALAADVEVHIRGGRPWFGYPMPDDFGIGTQHDGCGSWAALARLKILSASSIDFANPSIAPLPDCREGYPWLVPHHRLYSGTAGVMGGMIFNLGLRWQSLVISPERPPSMVPPAVPDDPHFCWWARLREVPSCWVSSRGESERFLYYDGPTCLVAPVSVSLENSGHQLGFKTPGGGIVNGRPEPYPKYRFEPLSANPVESLPEHEGLYIEVRSGAVRGQHMKVKDDTSVPLDSDLPLHGDAVVQELRTMLKSFCLTAAEAEGLIAAWTPQFFQADGRRFLLRMSAADYDWQCPMQVRPTPTEVVRLGLVLTEFDAEPAPR